MLIKNQEALKSWLVVVLEPLCDADSSALARYVLALLKKDKPEKELKKLMIEQLDVFLAEETKPFVERLFDAINTEDYFSNVILPAIQMIEDPFDSKVGVPDDDDTKEELIQEIENYAEDPVQPSDELPSTVCDEKEQTPTRDDNNTKELLSNSSSENHTSDTIGSIVPYTATVKLETPIAGSLTHHTYTGTNSHHVRSASPPLRANADKENQPRESRRRRASLRSRSRSRSRSNDRISRRSRSRDRRINEREKMQRQFRNKSPPMTDFRHVGSHDRRRGGGGSGSDRRRIGNSSNMTGSDDRSPRFVSSAGEGGSRKNRQNRSNSRSRSPSLERGVRNKGSPNVSRNVRGSPDRHNHHTHGQLESEKRQRCRDFDEKGYCVRGETCPWDHGINPVVFEDINNSALIGMSLPEYNPDAPDLWMRSTSGAMVGVSPNTLMTSGAGVGGGISATGINPFTGVARGGGILPVSGVSASVGFPQAGSGADKQSSTAGPIAAEYTRNSNSGSGFRVGTPMLPFPFNTSAVTAPLQRELIPIPVVDAGNPTSGGDISQMQQGKRRFDLEDSVAIADGPTKRKLPLNSRLGPRLPSIQNNCSLELRKIPRGLNTIAHLNNHFAKFGKIVNIQITYDGDPEAAIVTFSTHAEANVAYRSTEAVLNNRFIKVFWHSQETGSLIGDVTPMPIGSARKNSQYHLNNVPAVPIPTADSAKTANDVSNQSTGASGNAMNTSSANETSNVTSGTTPIAAAHVPPTSLRLKNNVPRAHSVGASNAIIRKKQEEQAKAVVQLANGLRKRKQELLQSYVKQMKSALEIVERCEQNDPQRSKTLETIKVLQETIDKLRKEIAAEQEQMQAQMQNQHPPPPKKTKEQQKKELLDIELELIAQQQEGNDTTAIQKRLEELQRSIGIVPGSGNAGVIPAHNPAVSGKAPHFPPSRANSRTRTSFPEGSTRVDRRPKTIVVTGFTSEEADFVLGHFKHFGEITKHDMDKEIPQLILSYATRINAEQAVMRGKLFKDKRLQISWAPVVSSTSANPGALITEQLAKPDAKSNSLDTTKSVTSPNTSDKHSNDSEITGETLPELRLEDEEDDEESEDRSWRR